MLRETIRSQRAGGRNSCLGGGRVGPSNRLQARRGFGEQKEANTTAGCQIRKGAGGPSPRLQKGEEEGEKIQLRAGAGPRSSHRTPHAHCKRGAQWHAPSFARLPICSLPRPPIEGGPPGVGKRASDEFQRGRWTEKGVWPKFKSIILLDHTSLVPLGRERHALHGRSGTRLARWEFSRGDGLRPPKRQPRKLKIAQATRRDAYEFQGRRFRRRFRRRIDTNLKHWLHSPVEWPHLSVQP
ncbi:uncharacterized protein VTP21DRAFT_4858 [Calcarisporiella thermophila]|uniref:uncharacterized protein n=1 Tax=Calcarisporiella thermophila TaxID=911321 RepID=UPI00374448E6